MLKMNQSSGHMDYDLYELDLDTCCYAVLKSDADNNTYHSNLFVVVRITVIVITTLNLCLEVEQSYRFYQSNEQSQVLLCHLYSDVFVYKCNKLLSTDSFLKYDNDYNDDDADALSTVTTSGVDKLIFGKGTVLTVVPQKINRDKKPHTQKPGLCIGIYDCAYTGSGWKLIFGAGTQLIVKPKTQRKIPSVYKLKSSESTENLSNLPNSVCLITDFPSPNKTLRINENDVNLTTVAVLDKSTNNIWRYSTVIWDNNKDVTCNGNYDSEAFSAYSDTDDTEETCSSISIDKNFRTNPRLNTMSLTVLGLRVLTAKAIIFNLIITLRLWSS
ncbi:M1-specific T cell receptor alpha chain-like [Lithobates pipiens]